MQADKLLKVGSTRMDLGSMLNTGAAPSDIHQEAISLYRRLSNGSASASPGQSPIVQKQQLRTERTPSTDNFRAPEMPPKSNSTPPNKRKLDQVDQDAEDRVGREIRAKQDKESTEGSAALPTPAAPTTRPPPLPSSSQSKPRTDVAYDGKRTLDELTSLVKDALLYYLTTDQRTYGKLGLEIEAKLGRIVDRSTSQRIHDLFPIDSSVLLHHGYDQIRFESNMTDEQHARFNRHLNGEVELRNPKHPDFDPARPKMTYLHTHLTDEIYPAITTRDGMELKPRVTRNDRDKSVVEVISKESITHLHILCPRYPFDIRLSINLEHKVDLPADGQRPVHERRKDRLSYRLGTHQIDLTKVGDGSKSSSSSSSSGANGHGGRGMSYELEVEMTDLENLKRQAELVQDERPNSFVDLVAGFMGTVMRLNRTAAEQFSPET